MAVLQKLRDRWNRRQREHAEHEAAQLEAEARGEAYSARSVKEHVRDQRVENDFPSRGAGQVGR